MINLPCVREVVVVDTASWDDTAAVAASAGAVVVEEPELGMGRALKTGYAVARRPWVLKKDADLETFDPNLVLMLPEAREPGLGPVKGKLDLPGKSGEHQLRNQEVFYGKRKQTDAGVSAGSG